MKLEDWAERLSSYIDEKRAAKFTWSGNDCARFARGAEVAQFGSSVFDDTYKRAYKSKKSAEAYLTEMGFSSLWDLVDTKLDRIDTKFAKRGDFVGHDSGDGLSLGVCLGEFFACPSDDGLAFLPMTNALTAWSLKHG